MRDSRHERNYRAERGMTGRSPERGYRTGAPPDSAATPGEARTDPGYSLSD